MTKPYYRPAIEDDVYALAPKLRDQDKDEVMASSGFSPEEALLWSFRAGGELNTIIAPDEEVIGMFGVSPTPDPMIGIPWLLASPRLPEISRDFLPQSLEWVKRINQLYPVLTNFVDERNTISKRWLKFLGFHFIALHEEFGVGKKPFIEFVRINNV